MSVAAPGAAQPAVVRRRGRPVRHRSLDGWRGVAVAAVVLFHAGLVPGGWLGVDLFLVLSGFLITRLLREEHSRQGSISLGGFWTRRARRLLPALVAMLVGVAVSARLLLDRTTLSTRLTGEVVATVAYVANWFQLVATSGYWDQYATPSPLEHMWSLAIEEQFYLLFPFAMIVLVAMTRAATRRIAVALALGAAASWSLGFWLLARGAGFERVYLGTDTRIGAVLLGGAAGALSTDPVALAALGRRVRSLALPAAIVVLVAMASITGSGDWPTWRWTVMPLFELGVCVLLLHAVADRRGDGAVTRTTSIAPLVWLGTISYGLYLWHVPVMVVARSVLPTWPDLAVSTVAIASSLAIAWLSFTVLERPMRTVSRPPRWWIGAGLLALALVLTSIWAVWNATSWVRAVERSRPAEGTAATDIAPLDPRHADASTAAPTTPAGSVVPPTAVPPTAPAPQALPMPRPAGRPARVLLLGDSMAQDLSAGLKTAAAGSGVVVSSSAMVGCATGGMDRVDGRHDALGSASSVAACADWLQQWGSIAQAATPDVAIVMRASARLPSVETGGPDVCGPGYRAWYRNETIAEVERLRPHVPVVVLASVGFARLGHRIDADHDRSTACRNEVLREVADERDGVVYLPVGEWVCPTADACAEEVDGVELRPDGLHFRDEGAVVASRWILQQLYG